MSFLVSFVQLFRPIFWLVLLFSPKFRERISFEKSYRDQLKEVAEYDLTIHISSEGELELAMPILQYVLEQQKEVLLIFTSPSAVRKIDKLLLRYPGNLSVHLLKMTYFFPFNSSLKSLAPSKNFMMVRYDFFPELLAYGKSSAQKFSLIAATLKGKEQMSYLKGVYYKWIYGHFDLIISSTEKDRVLLRELGMTQKIDQCEFRIPRIIERISDPSVLVDQPWYASFREKIESFPREKRIILGSCWNIDLDIFNDEEFVKEIKSGHYFIFLAPHMLDDQTIIDLSHKLDSWELPYEIVDKNTKSIAQQMIICRLPGILCELYQMFGHAYIGGGFGRSVHSVLEPFFSSEKIYTGPKIHRSTEVDLIQEIDQNVLNQLEFPHQLFSRLGDIKDIDMESRLKFGNEINKNKKTTIESIL